jgi:hypothetical protein
VALKIEGVHVLAQHTTLVFIKFSPEECSNWLKEAQHRRNCTKDCVRVIDLRPASKLNPDDNKGSYCQTPSQDHANSMPL